MGVNENKVLPITAPTSLDFPLKNRICKLTNSAEGKLVVIRAQPVPHFGKPFKTLIPEAKTVEICPFSSEYSDKKISVMEGKENEIILETGVV